MNIQIYRLSSSVVTIPTVKNVTQIMHTKFHVPNNYVLDSINWSHGTLELKLCRFLSNREVSDSLSVYEQCQIIILV